MSLINSAVLPLDTDTIAAESTPHGRGGISLIRVSGKNAIATSSALNPAISGQKPRRPVLRVLTHNGEWLDEALVTLFRAPASYTGEDTVEIAAHGNPLIVEKILHALCAAGARPAQPGEFTRRAYLNGRLPLTKAEAVAQLIHAESEAALRSAKNLYSGGLEKRLASIRENLLSLLAEVEALIDFIEEGIEPAEQEQLLRAADNIAGEISSLLEAVHQGRISQNGITVVLAGLPNAGKSSLLNALCHRQRAIVAPTPGTTRDTIETSVEWSGLLVRLTDTAGLRETLDPVESEGVRRTREALCAADIILWVTDATQPPPPALIAEINNHPRSRSLIVLNKTDLLTADGITKAREEFCRVLGLPSPPTVDVSALANTGIEELRAMIIRSIIGADAPSADVLNISETHKNTLETAAARLAVARQAIADGIGLELAAIDLRDALANIAAITAPVTNEELFGSIFSKFCIGK
jgi:tRNA modification GTPase